MHTTELVYGNRKNEKNDGIHLLNYLENTFRNKKASIVHNHLMVGLTIRNKLFPVNKSIFLSIYNKSFVYIRDLTRSQFDESFVLSHHDLYLCIPTPLSEIMFSKQFITNKL